MSIAHESKKEKPFLTERSHNNSPEKDLMKRDSGLLEEYELLSTNIPRIAPMLFFYTWDHTAVTLGKIQSNREKIIEEAKARSIPYYHRPTGGKAVLHGGDICYTFIAKQNDPIYGGNLLDSYQAVNKHINKIVADVFELDQLLEFACCDSKEKREHTDNCFEINTKSEGFLMSSTELFKVIGAAQQMYKGCFIQQGSIQVNKVDIDWDLFNKNKSISEYKETDYDLEEYCRKLNALALKIDMR